MEIVVFLGCQRFTTRLQVVAYDELQRREAMSYILRPPVTYLSVLQPHGQLVIHHGLKTLIVGLRVLLLALGVDLLDRLLVR